MKIHSQSSSDLWSESVSKMREGDLITGLELVNKYLTRSPNNKYAYHNKAIALSRLGDIRGACYNYKKAVSLGYTKDKKYSKFSCNAEYKKSILQKYFYKKETLLEENGYRPIYSRKDTLRGMLRKERTCFDVTFYDLSVRIITKGKNITGKNRIHFKTLDVTNKIQLDLFENLEIDSIIHNGNKLKFSREFDAIWIHFSKLLEKNSSQAITVYYHGKPRIAPKPPWDGGFVWKKSGLLTKHVGVACEQLGASVWWPNKDHLSDRPDSMAINIEVPCGYEAVCNGRLRNIIPVNKEYNRYEWFVQYPINNYNVTFYMGKFSEFTDTIYSLNDTLICRYHVLPKNLEKAKLHFKQANDVVDFYNRAFGPFPFWNDNFRMVESPFEGMEHQTAIAYGDAYNNKKNAITYLNKDYDYIIVHEAAHEWWGNSVTVGDMADAWIHEGFATYSEYLFLEEKLGYTESVIELQEHLKRVYNFWPMVQNRDVNEDSFAGGDIYLKGAGILHSLRSTINNDSLFKALIKGFYMHYTNNIVETNDFIEFTNAFLDKNYRPFFEKFLYDTEIPVLNYSYKRVDNGILFSYKWTEVPEGFEMAFGMEISADSSLRVLATTENQELLLEGADTFSFFNLSKDLSNAPHNSFSYYWTNGEFIEE